MAVEAAGAALSLLGNASAHMACERRKRVLKDLNKDLPLTEDEEAFREWECLGEKGEGSSREPKLAVEVYGTETWHRSVFLEGPLPRTWGGSSEEEEGERFKFNPCQPRGRD